MTRSDAARAVGRRLWWCPGGLARRLWEWADAQETEVREEVLPGLYRQRRVSTYKRGELVRQTFRWEKVEP